MNAAGRFAVNLSDRPAPGWLYQSKEVDLDPIRGILVESFVDRSAGAIILKRTSCAESPQVVDYPINLEEL
jgi:hypothetical protein